MRRRALLGALSAATLSGCLGSSVPGDSAPSEGGTPRPTEPQSPASDRDRICADGSRLQVVDEVRYGSVDAFSMDVDNDRVALGERLTVRLSNGAWSDRTIATRDHYDIQRRTGEGWQSIYHLEPDAVFSKVGRVFEARDSITWDVRLTRDGLGHGISKKDARTVLCSPLEPGQYRFVFFGLDNHTETDLGVRFELVSADPTDETPSDSPA